LAYSYQCNDKNINCKKGKYLTEELLKQHPESLDLKELKVIFDEKMTNSD
jgi:hypothetical protein